jgi:hypothetical protein
MRGWKYICTRSIELTYRLTHGDNNNQKSIFHSEVRHYRVFRSEPLSYKQSLDIANGLRIALLIYSDNAYTSLAALGNPPFPFSIAIISTAQAIIHSTNTST